MPVSLTTTRDGACTATDARAGQQEQAVKSVLADAPALADFVSQESCE